MQSPLQQGNRMPPMRFDQDTLEGQVGLLLFAQAKTAGGAARGKLYRGV